MLSHKLYGVDNTGNVKVWAAESMLLHVLLMNYSAEFENRYVCVSSLFIRVKVV